MTLIGKKWQPDPSTIRLWDMKDEGMAERDIADIAFERAWQVYRMIHGNIDEHDERRATLDRFIRKRCEAGAEDPELVVVEALKYLKRLDEYGERN
jgi:hypothetical protein